MANPRKPNHLKAIAGTARPCRAVDEVDLPRVSDVPAAPDWLPNAHAKKEWERLAPALHSAKLLTEPGLAALGHLCSVHGKLVQLWAADMMPSGHMLAQYRNLSNDFGLTPVAQGKVKQHGRDGENENAFAKNGKRPAAK